MQPIYKEKFQRIQKLAIQLGAESCTREIVGVHLKSPKLFHLPLQKARHGSAVSSFEEVQQILNAKAIRAKED